MLPVGFGPDQWEPAFWVVHFLQVDRLFRDDRARLIASADGAERNRRVAVASRTDARET